MGERDYNMVIGKKRTHFMLDALSEEAKTAFLAKLDAVKKVLMPAGMYRQENYDLLLAFLLPLTEDQASLTADHGVRARAQFALHWEGGEGSSSSVRQEARAFVCW